MGRVKTKTYSVVEELFDTEGNKSYFEKGPPVDNEWDAVALLYDAVDDIVFDIAAKKIKDDAGRTIFLNAEDEEIGIDYDGEHDAIVRLWEGYEEHETDRAYLPIANLDIVCWESA